MNNIYRIVKENNPYIWVSPVYPIKDYYTFITYRIKDKIIQEKLLRSLNKEFFVLLLKGYKFCFNNNCLYLNNQSLLEAYIKEILTIEDVKKIDNIIKIIDKKFVEKLNEYGVFLNAQAAKDFMIRTKISQNHFIKCITNSCL